MPRRPRESELDAKLRQLGVLQEMGQKSRESAATSNLADIRGLTDLYGISEKETKTPAELAQAAAQTELLKQHAAYYQERPEEMKARGIQLQAQALRAMYEAGLPKEAIEAQAREMGLLPQATATPMPAKGEYGPAASATPTPTPAPNNPSTLAADYTNIRNAIGGLFGATPQPLPASTPADYSFLFPKKKPQPVTP
jgi:hypothetical protein